MNLTPFEKCFIPQMETDRTFGELWQQWQDGHQELRETFNAPPRLAEQLIRSYVMEMASYPVFKNNKYQVMIRHMPDGVDHLSIKRIDKKPVHDWRDLQWIKNQLVGPEHEAVELYPAESRRVDTANQYHLWVVRDSKFRFPFGFDGGRHCTEQSLAGSVNRPFEK